MNPYNLYFDKASNNYLVIGDVACTYCEKEVKDIAFFFMFLRKEDGRVMPYCQKCRKNPSESFMVKSVFTALIVGDYPSTAVPIFLKAPEFNTARVASVFEVADPDFAGKIFSESSGGVKTVDNTRIGHESWQGASIGADVSDVLALQDKPLQTEEGLLLLKSLKTAEPLNSRFELEDKDEKVLLQ